ncbi:MAG: hypothetical protein M3Z33_11210 [Actinomycetota bacterium]|nr:hypothetical protein [Actinomycetota bacterium]
MTRITLDQPTVPTGLECDECGHREIDSNAGLDAVMARGWWSQSMLSSQIHLCGSCYRELEPMAREGYWRRQTLKHSDVIMDVR